MMAQRMIIPETAFRAPSKRKPRDESAGHLKRIRALPCCVCLSRATTEAAHVRMASRLHGKAEAGMGQKPDDKWAVPLCRIHHELQHRDGEKAFWSLVKIDPFLLALSLWAHTKYPDLMESTVLEMHRARGQ